MGLLLLDIRENVGVIAADQATTDLEPDGRPRRLDLPFSPKIVVAKSFGGLVGYFGSEYVDSRRTYDWLSAFVANETCPTTIDSFANELGRQLSQAFPSPPPRLGLFVVGYERNVGPQFWYVWNYTGIQADGSYGPGALPFQVRNELIAYINDARRQSHLADEFLIRLTHTFQFRNGTLHPFLSVVQRLELIVDELPRQDSHFPVLNTVDGLASYTLFKMEFIKRLYSKLHYAGKPPIDGPVSTYALDASGLWQKQKNKFTRVPEQR